MLDGDKDGKHDGVDLMEIYKIFVMMEQFFFETESFDDIHFHLKRVLNDAYKTHVQVILS